MFKKLVEEPDLDASSQLLNSKTDPESTSPYTLFLMMVLPLLFKFLTFEEKFLYILKISLIFFI